MSHYKSILFYFRLSLAIAYSINIQLFSIETSTEVEVLFRKKSHQNPWIVEEPIRQKSFALLIDSNTYFSISLANEIPLHGEAINKSSPNIRLNIKKYDPSTGFLLLRRQSPIDKNLYKIQFPKNQKTCSYVGENYIQLSFSSVPIQAFNSHLSGFSSEIAFRKNKFCGVVLGQYLIPYDYIELFNQSKEISPFPHPGFEFESALNSSEKSFYFPGKRKGIIVTTVYPGVGPFNQMIPGDSIFEINGIALSEMSQENLSNRVYDILLRNKGNLLEVNSDVKIKLNRMGQDVEFTYKLKPFSEDNFLVPSTHPFVEPPFLITGGIFFTELTGAYLKEFGDDYRMKSEKKLLFLSEFFSHKQHPHRDRVVILSRVLPHPLTQSYHGFQDLILESINGIKIRDLKQLKSHLRSNKEEFIRIHLSGSREIIIQRNDLYKIDSDIANYYKIKALDNIGH